MSDNPADSLRRELEAALRGAYAEFFEVHAPGISSAAVSFLADSVEPIVEVVRADERAKTLAMAAACAECFSDEAADDLWERAERAGWKVP